MAWYRKGTEGLRDDMDHSSKKDVVKRFWLKQGESRKIVFLDNLAFRFWEHNVCIDGSWKNWFVCLRENLGEECALCSSDNRPYFVGFYSVLDMTGYTDKKGVKHVNEKLLFPAKIPILEKLSRKDEKHGGLTGCIFDVTRGASAKSSAVGDDFDFVEKVELIKQFPSVDITPYQYEEILKPEQADRLKIIVAKAKDSEHDTEAVPY